MLNGRIPTLVITIACKFKIVIILIYIYSKFKLKGIGQYKVVQLYNIFITDDLYFWPLYIPTLYNIYTSRDEDWDIPVHDVG